MQQQTSSFHINVSPTEGNFPCPGRLSLVWRAWETRVKQSAAVGLWKHMHTVWTCYRHVLLLKAPIPHERIALKNNKKNPQAQNLMIFCRSRQVRPNNKAAHVYVYVYFCYVIIVIPHISYEKKEKFCSESALLLFRANKKNKSIFGTIPCPGSKNLRRIWTTSCYFLLTNSVIMSHPTESWLKKQIVNAAFKSLLIKNKWAFVNFPNLRIFMWSRYWLKFLTNNLWVRKKTIFCY